MAKGMAKVARIPGQGTARRSYWLIFARGCGRVETLTTRLFGGEEVLPVFSFREEAEMFLCLRDLRDRWQIRETGAGELRSMLCTGLGNIRLVALDPIPEVSGPGVFELLSLDRKTFMDSLEGV